MLESHRYESRNVAQLTPCSLSCFQLQWLLILAFFSAPLLDYESVGHNISGCDNSRELLAMGMSVVGIFAIGFRVAVINLGQQGICSLCLQKTPLVIRQKTCLLTLHGFFSPCSMT